MSISVRISTATSSWLAEVQWCVLAWRAKRNNDDCLHFLLVAVLRYCGTADSGTNGPRASRHQGEGHSTAREEVLGLDWWFYLGVSIYIPTNVVLKRTVRRGRSFHRSQILPLKAAGKKFVTNKVLSSFKFAITLQRSGA